MVQGPLITDGQNSSKRTGHYVEWSKTLQMVKISEQLLRKYFLVDILKIKGVMDVIFCIRYTKKPSK